MAVVRLVMAVAAAALLALPLATACGGGGGATGDGPPAATATTPGPGTAPAGDGWAAGTMPAGPGLRVAEVPAAPAGGLLAVRAHVVVAAGGSARLCDALAESHPPACAGASMPVTGLPEGLVAGLRSAAGVRWTDAPVQVVGRVRDGVLRVDAHALAAG